MLGVVHHRCFGIILRALFALRVLAEVSKHSKALGKATSYKGYIVRKAPCNPLTERLVQANLRVRGVPFTLLLFISSKHLLEPFP